MTTRIHKTQIARKSVSAPMNYLLAHTKINGSVLHFGEGLAFQDTDALRTLSNHVHPYDPFSPSFWKRVLPDEQFDYLVSFYVLNVLQPNDRYRVMEQMKARSNNLIIAVRSDDIPGRRCEDGVITKSGSFQKSYNPLSLRLELEDHGLTVDKLINNGHYLYVEAHHDNN